MSQTRARVAAEEPLVREVRVHCPVDHAFDVFTNRIDQWWPRTHRMVDGSRIALEGRTGGLVTGGLGVSLVVQPAGDSDNQLGFGALVGGGYELSPHWMVEANVAFGVPGDFDRSITAMAKVAYLHY